MERMNIPDPQDISSNPTASTTTVETRVNPVERITVTVEQTTETERCSSASTRLVQLSTTFDIPDATMGRDTGDSEYHACDDEPEEILRQLDRQVRDLLSLMEAKLYGSAQCEPEEDLNVIDGLENILHMELRLFQIILSLKGEIHTLICSMHHLNPLMDRGNLFIRAYSAHQLPDLNILQHLHAQSSIRLIKLQLLQLRILDNRGEERLLVGTAPI